MDSENPDLAWDLDNFGNRARATEFVKVFEHTLCVYSGAVEQLYSNYDIYYPEEEGRKLVILPDPTAYHDTFFNITPDAVLETGLYIIPGKLLNKQGLFLTNLLKDRTMGPRQIPFEAGTRTIMKKRPTDDPFLPVLVKGDLRELEDQWPVLHLHRIKVSALETRSALERKDIQDVITDKLEQLFEVARG
ncbi:MAG: hypothetical protein V2J24_18145 [Pseudomonadales bacterium]|jgi:hypothetical protein|nr:hypothetical protein [Pseudomonadales bacterium]